MARITSPANASSSDVIFFIGQPVSGKDVQNRLTDLFTNVAAVKSDTSAIKTKTDNLPANTATILGTPVTSVSADIAALNTIDLAIKTKTDNLPANTSTVLGSPAGASISADIATAQTAISAIKTKTDNLPSNTVSQFTDIKGAGWTSESLKSISDKIFSIQNNTAFTASVVPEMVIPASLNEDNIILINDYDGLGHLQDPDLNISLTKVVAADGTLFNQNLFSANSRTTAATKITIATITAPSIAPTAGAVYKDSANTQFTVIGMPNTTTLVASWTGATAPVLGSGTLTKNSGTGDSTLTASVVDSSWVKMLRSNVGQYQLFYNVQSTDVEQNVAVRFAYFDSGTWKAYDRSSSILSLQSVTTTAGAVWDQTTGSHATAGTFGAQDSDTNTKVGAIKTKTDNLPANTSSVLGTPSVSISADIATAQTAITAIKAKTDNMPANLSTTLGSPAGASVSADISAIAARTNNLPSNTSTVLGTPAGASVSADVAAVKSDTSAIKTKTDNMPANLASTLSTLQSSVSAIATLPEMVIAVGTSTACAQGATVILDLNAAAGFNAQKAQLTDMLLTIASGASSDYTVTLCEKSDGTKPLYTVSNIVPTDASQFDLGVRSFRNQDASPGNHAYVKITNNTDVGSSTFTVELRGQKMADVAA